MQFKTICCSYLCIGVALSMPSFDHGSLHDGSLLTFGEVLTPRAGPFEIRGVQGGRKKRYIIERQEPNTCSKKCTQKPICLPTLGQIIKDCKCEKCPTGIPALDGMSCQDNCPEGQEKNGQGGCCPIGQKPKPAGDGCEAQQDDRKGLCPGDKVLDPKEGQDSNTPNPKCQIDDEKNCAKPKIPATRPEGLENDDSYVVKCGQPEEDESKKPKCNAKTQYTHVSVNSEGKATRRCKHTKSYYNRKSTKPTNSDLRAKIKEKWNQLKPERETKDAERKAALEKLKELQEQRDAEMKERNEKLNEAKDKKKDRQARCSTCISLLLGAAYNEAMSKRDGDHPYDWTTDYFDEDFVGSDDRLQDWPEDIDVEQISAEVDQEAFLKKWDEYIDDHKREYHSCNFVGKRSLERRCSQRRSLEPWNGDTELHAVNMSSQGVDDISPLSQHHPGATSPGASELGKRNPLVLLFELLAQFGTRLGVQITARATASVAASSPRLANLLQNPERLFQIAKTGQGSKAGQQGMRNAKQTIKADDSMWKSCLKSGIPI